MPVLSVTMTSGIGSQKERGSGVMRADTITAANVIAPVISIGLLITGQDERLARRRAKCFGSAPGVSQPNREPLSIASTSRSVAFVWSFISPSMLLVSESSRHVDTVL